MIPRLPLRVAYDQAAHTLLCVLRQRPAKMVVDSSDCSDGVARNFVKFYVANPPAGQSIAFIQEFVHGFGPVMNCFPADRKRIDGVAKSATKNSHQTRYRSHRIDGCPMRLHKQRIRIDGQQCRHGGHVSRRFQYPTASSPPKLQMLKKLAMIFVCRP
jgi:hypothetical protein